MGAEELSTLAVAALAGLARVFGPELLADGIAAGRLQRFLNPNGL